MPRMHLIVMKGHPATGKSMVARALAQHLRWPLIDKDDVKDHTLHLDNGNQLAYAIMWQVVETQLALGLNVIADSPLSYPNDYATARSLSNLYDANLLVVETQVDKGIWRQRLEERSPHDSAHKMRGWQAMQEQLRLYDGCWRYPIDPAHHLLLDTSQPLSALLEQVMKAL